MLFQRKPSDTTTLHSVVSDASTLAPGQSANPGFFKRKLYHALSIPLQSNVDTLVSEGFGEDAVRAALKYGDGSVEFPRRVLVHERDHTIPLKSCTICRAGGIENLRKSNGIRSTTLTGMKNG